MARKTKQGLLDLEPTDSCGVGFVASLRNEASHAVLQLALTSLENVAHRGAIGADGITGDGAGVTTTLPLKLVAEWLRKAGKVHSANGIGVGVFFLPPDITDFEPFYQLVREQSRQLNLRVIGFRNVPVCPDVLGQLARQEMPTIVQAFFDAPHDDAEQFERELFLLRRSLELVAKPEQLEHLYVASLSSRTISYKAMVQSARLGDFFPDLQDENYLCNVCLYHQRFSTNTRPEWSLCQPFRMLAHNGEINTVRGNRNWMTAREASLDHPYWKLHHRLIRRLFSFNDSDSASLDNTIELLALSGRSLVHSIAMLIPPAWESDPRIPQEVKDFYEYHSCFSEPWDGPAAVALTDGQFAVAKLDRNGLRPLRYKVTTDDLMIVGSEVGADQLEDPSIREKGRLGPGEILAVDLESGEIWDNRKVSEKLARTQPYGQWLKQNRVVFQSRQPEELTTFRDDVLSEDFHRKQIASGLTKEEIEIGIAKMAETGIEPTFSMGVDTPLAVLSQQPRPLTDYFKQRFAQVTNPPIDPIREKMVMSLSAGLGPERNFLAETPEHCRILALDNPILLPGQLSEISSQVPFVEKVFKTEWRVDQGTDGMPRALRSLVQDIQLAIENGVTLLVLDDEVSDKDHVAFPMLMAVGAIHHALYRSGQRMMCSIICKTSQVRDAHQLALLYGYGATAVYPYLAYQSIERLRLTGKLEQPQEVLFRNYRSGLSKGMLKIMSKMGISVLNSYQGAQIFEAIGIGPELIDSCFKYSFSNIGGIGFKDVASDCLYFQKLAYESSEDQLKLHDPGISKPKRSGEHHVINGKVTKNLHQFVRQENEDGFNQFSGLVHPEQPAAIRDLFSVQPFEPGPIDLSKVESIEKIRTRFTTAAMSLGAISPEAHEAIAIAMNETGGKSNSGEGGEDPERFFRNAKGLAVSKIKQVASGRFGVDADYLTHAEEIEIKMAQGAKPGEGGQLPGFKVNELIARLRNTEPGVTLISPPPHHDIYSIEDLAQLITDLKVVNPLARVCVKLVAKTGMGGIAVGVAKAKADSILISGHEGGTGASPLTSIKHAGIPWELGLTETHQSLVASSLRSQVVLRMDGGVRTGRDVVLAAILGAEEFNFGTMALIALGCVYVKKCHLNNCPVGIATQDENYRAKFKGKPEHLINYLNGVAEEVREFLASIGATSIDQIVGRTDLLAKREFPGMPKTQGLDLSRVAFRVKDDPVGHEWEHQKTEIKSRSHIQVDAFDDKIIEEFETYAETNFDLTVKNTDRNIGTRLSGFLVSNQLTSNPVNIRLTGTAGQSLGAFLVEGVNIDLSGEANDYVGKGMSGGKIVMRPSQKFSFANSNSVIAGNTICYGATGGKLYAAGIVAERLCVRNSGATVVVEGCGDHGCEYMTRGTAVILGQFGNNFAAGMTGGKAYVFDPDNRLPEFCNQQTVEIRDELSTAESGELLELLKEFADNTSSAIANRMLSDWDAASKQFAAVVPLSPQKTETVARKTKRIASNAT